MKPKIRSTVERAVAKTVAAVVAEAIVTGKTAPALKTLKFVNRVETSERKRQSRDAFRRALETR